MGPFVNAAIGHYDTNSYSTPTHESSRDTDGGFHEWFTVGVRGQFNL